MSSDFCPNDSNNPAVTLVGSAYNHFINLGDEAFAKAMDLMQQLTATLITPIFFSANFDFGDQLTPFVRPARPVIDDSAFDFRDPGAVVAPPTFTPNEVSLTDAPTDDSVAPELTFGPTPLTPNIVAPVAPPSPGALVVPAPPPYVIPQVPSFESLQLPTVPTIVIPDFDDSRPDFVEPPLDDNWTFQTTQYVSALLDKITAKMLNDLDGGTGLPAAIEQALFDRGREKIVIEADRVVEQAFDEFAARGFTEPNGVLNARVMQARQDGQNKIADINRDLTIQFHQEQLLNLRFAVTSGTALEGAKINLHIQDQQLALQAAQYARETAIAVLNARIAVFNARLAAYQTDAQVFATLIQATLAKVELYKAEIEAQQLIGQINQQQVELYTAQLQGIQALATFYTAQVEGVKAQADVNRAIIDSFRAEVDAFTAQWQAYTAQWEGYKASVQAQASRADIYKTGVDAFGVRVTAWNAEQSAHFEQERLRIADSGQKLETWKALLQQNQQRLAVEGARLGAVASGADSKVRLYSADAGVEQAVSAANDRAFELLLERARAEVDTQLKAAEIRIQENIQIMTLDVDVRRSLAQIMSQIAASLNSAMSFSSGVSSSQSDSRSCSQSLAYSGDAQDLGS